ncbi:MAG: hypothetical protein AAGJ83_15860, partial [Planctomycetota bacterium]
TKHGPQYAEVVELDLEAPEKLRRIAGIFEHGVKSGRPCLLASIASGISTLSPDATEHLKVAANASIRRFAEVFAQGRTEASLDFEGSPIDAATGFFAMLQGLQALCRAKGDTRAFKKTATSFIQSLTTNR